MDNCYCGHDEDSHSLTRSMNPGRCFECDCDTFAKDEEALPAHLAASALLADIAKGLDPQAPGPYRRASILLSVPAEARIEVSAHSVYLCNIDAWRPSDALAHAARRWTAGYRHNRKDAI